MRKILVIGDLMIDNYLYGNCDRISPEAPVPIIDIYAEKLSLGGAGNVANNIISLGSDVDIISVIGDCSNTKQLLSMLRAAGINNKYLIIEKNRKTAKKSRLMATHQQVIRFDSETITNINNVSEEKIMRIYNKIIINYDCVILSDYNKGLLTTTLVKNLINTANQYAIKVLIDPKGSNYSKYNGAYLLTPNSKEASIATGIIINDKLSLTKAIIALKKQCNLTVSIITMGEKGIAIFDDNLRTHPTKAIEVFDVTGAGDTVIASLAIAIANGKNIDKAVDFANIAAGIVVGKVGSSTTTMNEINDKIHNKIKDFAAINIIVKQLKLEQKKIIFTNGCFDILHLGHIKYLQQAKKFGDILIVGINSDKSVKRLKGEKRPINPEFDRAYLLSSLDMIDFVVLFAQDTPYELIKIIQPDILVKGNDYQQKEVVGSDIARQVQLVEFIKNKSTTNIIKKIKQQC